MHLRPLGHLSRAKTFQAQTRSPTTTPGSAERVGVEPTVPLRIHLISNQAPSATRSSLRGGLWQRAYGLSTLEALPRLAKWPPQFLVERIADVALVQVALLPGRAPRLVGPSAPRE